MCLLAIQYRLLPEAPILVAANREEDYDRPSTTPSIRIESKAIATRSPWMVPETMIVLPAA